MSNFDGYDNEALWSLAGATATEVGAIYMELFDRLGHDAFIAALKAQKRSKAVAFGCMRLAGWHGADHAPVPKVALSNLQRAAKLVDKLTQGERSKLVDYMAAKEGII